MRFHPIIGYYNRYEPFLQPKIPKVVHWPESYKMDGGLGKMCLSICRF